MLSKLNATKLLNFIYVLYLLSLLEAFVKQLLAEYGYASVDWNVSEFLINYQGGFVRRGLLGEILFFLAKNYHINVEWTIKIFSLIMFAAVCTFFVKSFVKRGYTLYILPTCFFLGVFILFPCWIKKDALMLLAFITILWIWSTQKAIPIFGKIIFINLLAMLMIFIHEVFAIWALPILFLLLFNHFKKGNITASIGIALACLLPSIAVFLVVISASGDAVLSQKIWDSWHILSGKATGKVPHWNAVGAIGWPRNYTFIWHLRRNYLTIDNKIISCVYWAAVLPVVYYVVTNALMVFKKSATIFTNEHKTILSAILVFQFFALIPLFTFLSVDLGRIFLYWTSTAFIIFLLLPLGTSSSIFPKKFIKTVQNINDWLSKILRPSKSTLAFLLLFVAISSYGFVVPRAYNTMIAYRALQMLSQPFIILKEAARLIFS